MVVKCSVCKAAPVSDVALRLGRLLCWICHASQVRAAKEKHYGE